MIFPQLFRLLAVLAFAILAGCSAPTDRSPGPAATQDIVELTRAFQALGPEVDPEEAARAARIAYEHTYTLALQYQITDPPLIHNTKVNMGLKPRGLCWHWAEDIETRLAQENFQTLDLHRAIANHDKPLRIEHSTTIVSRRGDGMYDGIVVDPWRLGGVLTWVHTDEDADYDWVARDEVFAYKRAREARRTRFAR
ncbi:MAG: hypothetical protein AAFX59_06355 [Pseudomonadota bacterium]